MYIDVVPNRQSPPAVLLRESYREHGKVKKRTLANLSKLPRELIEHLRQALAGQAMAVKETVCGAIYGLLFVLNELARQCRNPAGFRELPQGETRAVSGAGTDWASGFTMVCRALGARSCGPSGARAERFH